MEGCKAALWGEVKLCCIKGWLQACYLCHAGRRAGTEQTRNVNHINLTTKPTEKLHYSLQQSIISPKMSLNNIIFLKDKTRKINNCRHHSMKSNHFLYVKNIIFNSSCWKYCTKHTCFYICNALNTKEIFNQTVPIKLDFNYNCYDITINIKCLTKMKRSRQQSPWFASTVIKCTCWQKLYTVWQTNFPYIHGFKNSQTIHTVATYNTALTAHKISNSSAVPMPSTANTGPTHNILLSLTTTMQRNMLMLVFHM